MHKILVNGIEVGVLEEGGSVSLDVSLTPENGDFLGAEALFGTAIEPDARATYEFEEFVGQKMVAFTVGPDIKQAGFRWNGSAEAAALGFLKDISMEIVDADGNALTGKLATYAGVRGPAARDGYLKIPGVGNWSRKKGDYRDTLPKVEAGTYFLRVTCRVPRPVPLLLEVS